VPIFIQYFGVTKYGLWAVILSLVSYLSNSQFGLGTVTSVLIAKTEDLFLQKTIVSRTMDILFIISLCLVCLSIYGFFNPDLTIRLIGDVPNHLISQATQSLTWLYFLYALRLPFVAITAAFVGQQDMKSERLYIAILPPVLNFSALIFTRLYQKDLVFMALFIGLGQIVISLCSAGHYYLKYNYFYFKNNYELLEHPNRAKILKNGSLFFIGGLAATIITNTDNLILSHFFGSDQVASYSITYKVFTIGFSVFFILNASLWPMFGRALVKNEISWIQKIFSEATICFPLIGGLIWLGGFAFMSELIELWIGNTQGYAGISIVFALGGYGYLASVVNFQMGLLSGVNHARIFMWICVVEAIVNLILSIIFCKIFGPSGVAYGTFLATLFTSLFLAPGAVQKYIHKDLVFPWGIFMKHAFLVLLPAMILIYVAQSLSLPHMSLLFTKILIVLFYCIFSMVFLPVSIENLIKEKIRSFIF